MALYEINSTNKIIHIYLPYAKFVYIIINLLHSVIVVSVEQNIRTLLSSKLVEIIISM